jgi:outer membrane protein TolC
MKETTGRANRPGKEYPMKRLYFRRLARWGFAGLPCVGLACAQFPVATPTSTHVPMVSPSAVSPSADSAFNVRLSPEPTAYSATTPQTLPVSLDAVMRLAEESNPQVAAARAKVCTAFAERELAAAKWVPDINIGVGYWRHEGGIQLQEGPLIDSSTGAFLSGMQINATYNPREYAFRQLASARKVWQSHGEMTRISTEQLLDASSTYIDLLAAHTALAVSRDLEVKISELLEKQKKVHEAANKSKPTKLDLSRIEAEFEAQKQGQQKLKAQIEAASAKLTYLLGLGEAVTVVPVDSQMAAFHLVDASVPADAMVAQALAAGPGIRELEGVLCVIKEGLNTASGAARWVPQVDVQLGEGLFGAGFGSTMNWSNRLDLGIQAKWNVSDLLLADRKKAVAFAQMNEVQWSYQELRAKLTLGVQEARATIQNMGTQFTVAEGQIKRAKEAAQMAREIKDVDMMDSRLTFADVALSHKAVAMAQMNYVEILREFDKAQLRLMVLLGAGATGPAAPVPQAPAPK